jgi:hypothetical protein
MINIIYVINFNIFNHGAGVQFFQTGPRSHGSCFGAHYHGWLHCRHATRPAVSGGIQAEIWIWSSFAWVYNGIYDGVPQINHLWWHIFGQKEVLRDSTSGKSLRKVHSGVGPSLSSGRRWQCYIVVTYFRFHSARWSAAENAPTSEDKALYKEVNPIWWFDARNS